MNIIMNYVMLIFLISIFIGLKIYRQRKNHSHIMNLENYVVSLDFFLVKAYDIVYKDKILTYSLEGYKVDDIDFAVISKEFSVLVIKFMGPNMYNEYSDFFGSEDSFFLYLSEYFNTRYEDDEIRKATMDNITNNEDI